MILVDSNVLMYAAGAAHHHKKPSMTLLQRIAFEEVEGIIDAEVLQEILHRYRAINRWKGGCRAYDLARRVFQVVVPITADVVDDTRQLMDIHDWLTARDALHAAVCGQIGADAICSYDRDFDRIAQLKRVRPQELI